MNERDKGMDIQLALHANAYTSSVEVVAKLLNNGADPLWLDSDGKSALHNACGRSLQVAEVLIHKGADIHAKEKFSGFTPLLCACRFGREDIALMLIRHGANITDRTPQRTTTIVNRFNTNHSYEMRSKTVDDLCRTNNINPTTLFNAFTRESNWRRRKWFIIFVSSIMKRTTTNPRKTRLSVILERVFCSRDLQRCIGLCV